MCRKKIVRTICLLLALSFAFSFASETFATVTGPDADGTQGILASGTVDDFAKDAPISTVTIDLSKVNIDDVRLDLSSATCEGKCSKVERVAEGSNNYYYVIRNAALRTSAFRQMGSMTLVYPGGATLSDGTVKDVKVLFNKLTIMTSKAAPDNYTDDIRLFRLRPMNADYDKKGQLIPTLAPMLEATGGTRYHIGVRAELKIRIDDPDGESASATKISDNDTMLVTIEDVNVRREGTNFINIVSSGANYNYSESVQIKFDTLSAESDAYITGDHLNEEGLFMNFVEDDDRLVGYDGSIHDYRTGVAMVGKAHHSGNGGTEGMVWTSAGTNASPIEYYILPGGISHTSKSSSGSNGVIELWTSGIIDDNVTKLDGGTLASPRTYNVPNGKVVTYKMTPNTGYEIDKLKVQGVDAQADPVTVDGEVAYYTYTFNGSEVDNQEIVVTWKKKTVAPDDDILVPDTGVLLTNDDAIQYEEWSWIIGATIVVLLIVFGRLASKKIRM